MTLMTRRTKYEGPMREGIWGPQAGLPGYLRSDGGVLPHTQTLRTKLGMTQTKTVLTSSVPGLLQSNGFIKLNSAAPITQRVTGAWSSGQSDL